MKPAVVDLRGLQPGFKAHFGRGLGRLTEGVARHLVQAAPDLNLVGLTQRGLPPPPPDALPGRPRLEMRQPLARVRGMVRLLGQEIILPRLLRARAGSALFAAHLDAPASGETPTVLFVPDLIMARGAGSLAGGGWYRRILRAMERRAVLAAGRVLAISRYTADEVISFLGADPARVRVVPLACGPEFARVGDPAALAAARGRLGLPERFFLHVGGFDPRKNLPRLVAAFGRLLAARPEDAEAPRLVLAGSLADAGQVAPVRQAVDRAGLAGKVIFQGFVADADLPALYSLAEALVFPSLYEGFGFPALEALACGTPVLCGQGTSIPEVVDRAGLFFDPLSEEDMARAMSELLDHPGLAAGLRRAGPEQAARFTWRRTAELTAQAMREILAETGVRS